MRRWRIAAAGLCWAVAAGLILGAGLPAHDAPGALGAAPVAGMVAPAISGDGLAGPVALPIPAGAPAIVNFWATWCAPCAVEMPELQRLAAEHPGLIVIGVNAGESRAEVADWARRFQITFPLLLDRDGAIARRYGVIGQPTTFLIAPSGAIARVFLGPVDAATLNPLLETLATSAP